MADDSALWMMMDTAKKAARHKAFNEAAVMLRVSVYGFAVKSLLRQFVENRAAELEARAKEG